MPDNQNLNKVALITGGAQRIGAAISETLHASGCNVVIHYKQSAKAAEKLIDRLNQIRPASAAMLHGDLLETARLPRLIQAAYEKWESLDILVNNASSFYPTHIGEIKEEHCLDLFGTNFNAPLFLSQAAIPHLKKTHGCIVNIIDIHAERPMGNHTVYSAAKAALASLTKSLARELAPEIRVNGISPGAILWPEQAMTEQTKASILHRVTLQRSGEPSDVANAVKFLVFDALYTTGHILPIDGGRSLYI